MFGVGDGVADDALEEGLEDAAGFFVDHWARGRGVSGSVVLGCVLGLCRGEEGEGEERRMGGGEEGRGRERGDILAEIRFTPPRRARRRMAGLVMPWMLSRRILR